MCYERRIFAVLFSHHRLTTSIHESSRYVLVTTSLLVGGSNKTVGYREHIVYNVSEARRETRNTSWRIVFSHHLAKKHPGVLCCVFVTGPIPSLLFLSRSVFFLPPPPSLHLIAFLFLFLSALALSPLFLAVRSSTRKNPEVSKTRYIFF